MAEEKRTLEQIEDQELAQLFSQKNHESLNSESAEISDLFVHTRKEFFSTNPSPTEELASKLREETASKAPITQSLEKAVQTYQRKKIIRKKLSDTFSLRLRKQGELMTMNIPFLGADYRYFYLYLAQYRKELKNAWTEFNGFVEVSIKAPGAFAKLKKFELTGVGILLILLSSLLFAKSFLTNWDKVAVASPHASFFGSWLSAIVTLSLIAFIVTIFPYLVLGIFYFININYLYQSKYFHYFICLCIGGAGILFLTAFFNFLFYQYIQLTGGWGIVDLKYETKK